MTEISYKKKQIKSEIEQLRKELNEGYNSKDTLDNKKLLRISMELDNKINKLMQLQRK
ncbi:aspartyl-phosphate phosphatase Spo0E family protein [Proteinivorax hydrogeniformans]|uniref:Aspartyl-phosphate phosphatase Spo0E family protein n=1 Tax=Proteinivorax hydrogeniformans TaxID=1826727 RepID=A0AAU8HPW4_9FIRM